MTTRIQLNSKTYKVDVFKSMPSLEENKRYALKVERLTVPAMSGGLILNQPLFTVERRLTVNSEYICVEDAEDNPVHVISDDASLHIVESTFTPTNVRTTSELVYQMNSFFRKLLLSLVTSQDDFGQAQLGNDVYAIPAIYEPEDLPYDDWYQLRDTVLGDPIQTSLEAVFRCDGRIGIKFSAEAIPMFALKLTTEGKRIFGWDQDHMVVDQNNGFEGEYLTNVYAVGVGGEYINHINVTLAVPANPAGVIGHFENNIFSHSHYRHELVVRTSLPMRNYLECDQKFSSYRNQLASYRYPNEPIIQEYDGTMFRVLKNVRRNRYMFEQSTKTHNEFLLTGSKLQNFHLRLMQRNYKWDAETEVFNISEVPYKLPTESLWTIQLAIKPLRA